MSSLIESSFWEGKKVFLTGHTGFKGSWLSIWLTHLGAEVKGYSLDPVTKDNLYETARISDLVDSDINDIRDFNELSSSLNKFCPDIVIHMAAQPLVRFSYKNPLETYETNVMGTAKVLESSRQCNTVKAIVNITTDKCYENKDQNWGYKESDPMGGVDPYSSSKGCAEIVTSAYRRSFLEIKDIGVSTARAGNVIGGGDWAEDRLIPDILRSFEKEKPVRIRYPKASRPWQHVLDPLYGYLVLTQRLFKDPLKFSTAWNFGPYERDVKSVEWILRRMVDLWPGAKWELDETDRLYESQILKLDITKAVKGLGWTPTWNIDVALEKIIDWHKSWKAGEDMQLVCLEEIKQFTKSIN